MLRSVGRMGLSVGGFIRMIGLGFEAVIGCCVKDILGLSFRGLFGVGGLV